MSDVYAVVLAGGSGTRFWPASRRARPKQLLPLAPGSDSALIADTVRRISPLAPPERVVVATGRSLVEGTRRALPQLSPDGFLAEPVARNTAPCIAWAASVIHRRNPDAVAMVLPSDHHIADVIHHLERSPQWGHMLVVVTYDENGGIWDHVAPPKGDRWGPGTRIPAIIVSPYAKHGYVDHTLYDTNSILRFIIHRFDLPNLEGIKTRDAAMAARGQEPIGDLSGSLNLI